MRPTTFSMLTPVRVLGLPERFGNMITSGRQPGLGLPGRSINQFRGTPCHRCSFEVYSLIAFRGSEQRQRLYPGKFGVPFRLPDGRPNPEYRKAYYEANKDKIKEALKRYYLATRREAFVHYGRNCSECKESNEGFLTLDHINDDGAKHRRTIGSNLYLWAKRNHYPPVLQTMCYSCQWTKEIRREAKRAFANQTPTTGDSDWTAGSTKGFCSRCRTKLSPETCRPSVLAAEYGLCRSCQSKDDTRRDHEIKRIVMEHFGGKCVCCREMSIDKLTLGHPNWDGNKDRKISGRGTSFYRRLVRNNFRTPYLLGVECINCNFGSYRNSGVCPHDTAVASHEHPRGTAHGRTLENDFRNQTMRNLYP